jgi:hypothetical protein
MLTNPGSIVLNVPISKAQPVKTTTPSRMTSEARIRAQRRARCKTTGLRLSSSLLALVVVELELFIRATYVDEPIAELERYEIIMYENPALTRIGYALILNILNNHLD